VIAVRALWQVVIVLMLVLVLVAALDSTMTAMDLGNLLGGLLFLGALFVATLQLGADKEKQWLSVDGQKVDPKTFGALIIVVGLLMVVGGCLLLFGQPPGKSNVYVRGRALMEMLAHVPLLLVLAGLAMCWYGVKVFRARQPQTRIRRTRAKARRSHDAEH